MSTQMLHGDCMDVMPTLPDDSFDLILTDPPYYRFKTLDWDRQWATPEAYLVWLDACAAEWFRLLRPNGSLYVFASPQMAARVEVTIGGRFNVLNSIVWQKSTGNAALRNPKDALRGFIPNTERIIFAEHHGADSYAKGEAGYATKLDELRGFVFEPLRAYLDEERRRAGIDKSFVDAKWCEDKGVKQTAQSQKWFSTSCWNLPTPDNYSWLRRLFNERGQPPNGGGEYLRREYEDLRREYEDLRRPFAVTADDQYTDVWRFATVPHRPGKHPAEKPVDLLAHIIRASSRDGARVLDCFAGSGATGEAVRAVGGGREFVGIEAQREWVDAANARLAQPIQAALSV